MGDDGGEVKVDKTFIGCDPAKKKAPNARGGAHNNIVLSLVDRRTGRAKSIVVDDLKGSTLMPILRENIARERRVSIFTLATCSPGLRSCGMPLPDLLTFPLN